MPSDSYPPETSKPTSGMDFTEVQNFNAEKSEASRRTSNVVFTKPKLPPIERN